MSTSNRIYPSFAPAGFTLEKWRQARNCQRRIAREERFKFFPEKSHPSAPRVTETLITTSSPPVSTHAHQHPHVMEPPTHVAPMSALSLAANVKVQMEASKDTVHRSERIIQNSEAILSTDTPRGDDDEDDLVDNRLCIFILKSSSQLIFIYLFNTIITQSLHLLIFPPLSPFLIPCRCSCNCTSYTTTNCRALYKCSQ